VSEQNKLIHRRICEEAIGQGDVNVIQELVSDDFVGHASSPDMDTRGVEAYKQFVAGMHRAFPDLQITVEDQLAEGDKVVTRWRARGTHKGEYFGIPPSGKQGEMTGMSIDRIVDGKTVECWTNSDDLGLLRQIGAIPS
jgi:steroid delta-isomerase-like uncharacterized protein